MHIPKNIRHILNKQFSIIGESMTFEAIPDDAYIQTEKKKLPYWEVFKFKNEEEYRNWRDWAEIELLKLDIKESMDSIDLKYGLNYKLSNSS